MQYNRNAVRIESGGIFGQKKKAENGTRDVYKRQRIRLAKHAGMQVMEMYRKNIRPRDIMTKEAILNALIVDMALGCSTNSMLHLPAIAHEIGMDFDISFANEISAKTPNPVSYTHLSAGAQAVYSYFAPVTSLVTSTSTGPGRPLLSLIHISDTAWHPHRPYADRQHGRPQPRSRHWRSGNLSP